VKPGKMQKTCKSWTKRYKTWFVQHLSGTTKCWTKRCKTRFVQLWKKSL